MTDIDIKELRRLAEAATQGEWRSILDDTGGPMSGWPLCIVAAGDDDRTVVRTGGMWPYEWDAKVSQHEAVATAAFIAAASPATVLKLIEAVWASQVGMTSNARNASNLPPKEAEPWRPKWGEVRSLFTKHAEAFVKATRYEEASAIADAAAREIEELFALPHAPNQPETGA
jgi:hypothetical protein